MSKKIILITRAKRMGKKRFISLLIGVFIIIVGGIFVYQGFVREEPLDFVLEKAFRGDVEQEVVETGKVSAGEEINISFKNMGRIERVYVEVGALVEQGQVLAELDTTQLFIQLNEAKAGLKLAKAGLAQFMAGAREQEIRIAQTSVDALEKTVADSEKSAAQRIIQAEAQKDSAQVSLQGIKQHLIDTKASAERELNQANEHGLNILNSAELKIDNAFNAVDSIQQSYFGANDQESIRVRTHKIAIKRAREYNTTLSKTRQNLEIISDSLAIIREICDVPAYRHIVSDASRVSLDTQRTNINTALTNVINAQKAIFSAQSIGQAKINTAEGQVDSAESALKLAQENLAVAESETALQLTQVRGQLNTARRQLELKQADPRQVDIALYQAQIKQAQARKALLQEQIRESITRSPVEGKIIEVFKKRGEIIQPMQSIVSLLPIAQFEIEVDIYEEDVVKIETGNLVKIELIAFPDETLEGEVISIDPTEKLIDGVVHYETIIAFVDEPPKGAKPGMTVDIVIKTAFRENVLIIPEDAIQEKNNKFIVQVFKDGLIEEREIEIGLKGEDDRIEVIAGLKQGEQVIIR